MSQKISDEVASLGPRRMSRWAVIGALLAGLSVATGAIGAHGIQARLADNYAGQVREIAGVSVPAAEKYLADFKTASQYQMTHALALIVVGLLLRGTASRALHAAGWLFLVGICLFCGSLYWLSLMSHLMPEASRHRIGLTAATGGTLLIAGWCVLAVGISLGGSLTKRES